MKTINKNSIIKLITGLTAGGLLLSAVPVMAATSLVTTPSVVNVTPGSTFTLTVAIDPQGTANYAEKIELIFPADLLEVKSFTFANNWMALTQGGYDVVDNTTGVLVKSAGLPSGLSTLTTFGTVTFSAKKSGTGTIKVGSNSTAFEASSQNSITGAGTSVNVAVVSSNTDTTKTTTNVKSVTATSSEVKTAVSSTTSVSENTNMVQATQTASVADSGFNKNWFWAIGALVVLGLVYFFTMRKGKNDKSVK